MSLAAAYRSGITLYSTSLGAEAGAAATATGSWRWDRKAQHEFRRIRTATVEISFIEVSGIRPAGRVGGSAARVGTTGNRGLFLHSPARRAADAGSPLMPDPGTARPRGRGSTDRPSGSHGRGRCD